MIRARDMRIPFEGIPGQWNAITDIPGVEVGYSTIIRGEGTLQVGVGPVRTGVTAILPRGKTSCEPVFSAWFPFNGNGEMTGTTWVEESGQLEGPICITNTHSVGIVRDAVVGWLVRRGGMFQSWANPVVAETYDGVLNDINGFHVKEEHVLHALQNAASGPIAEGNVGGGTGMVCFEFKGGTGTASRIIQVDSNQYTVGVIVQANFGLRSQLMIAGVPVGKHFPLEQSTAFPDERGSIIVVIATDAPLLPHQLKRVAKRAALGIARTGGLAGNGSGDIFMAFSTANRVGVRHASGTARVDILPNDLINPLFEATVWATEEAILNALVSAETMSGVNGHSVPALPHDKLRDVLLQYNRLG